MNTTVESPIPVFISKALQQMDSISSYGYSGLAIAFVLVASCGSYLFSNTDEGVPYKAGIPFIGSWTFFTHRHNFSHQGLKKLGRIFSFNVLQHKVLMVSGEDARKVFFNHKDLGFSEGYAILFGGAPKLEDIKVEKVETDSNVVRSEPLMNPAMSKYKLKSAFGKRLLSIIRRDRLAKSLPLMLQDLDRRMLVWGASGKFNPFDDIYNMVYQLTIRATACCEVANDIEKVKRVTQLYYEMEMNSTPSSILLTWFPSAARKRKQKATTDLYILFKDLLDKRVEEGREEVDPAQFLLDDGDSTSEIVQFIIGALFAGIINTGIMASWLLLFLGENTEWKARVLADARAFVAKYPVPPSENGTYVSLSEQLAQLPPQVWEDEMSTLDNCIRETIRIVMTGSTLRRVMPNGEDVMFGKHKVKPGTFLAHPTTAVHLDPEIYPEPLKWDPSRFDRGEDKKEQWAFIGWGVGRHPCLGMRFAKLEIKMIITLFLMQYEYKLVEASGQPVVQLPQPRRENLYQVPPSRPVYVDYKRVHG